MKTNYIYIISNLIIISILFLVSLTLPSDRNEKNNYTPLGYAIKQNIVTANVKGKGGHQEFCISLLLNNLLDVDTAIWIEPGRRFISADTNIQDILVVKEQLVALKAHEQKHIDVYGFCCEAKKSSPKLNEIFSVGKIADSLLVSLAKFLNKNNFPVNAMQNAIWCLSDNHGIESISDEKLDRVKALHKYVAALKGQKIEYSWYTIKYATDSNSLFSGIPETLYAEFEYELWTNCKASLILYDSKNYVIKRFFIDTPHNPKQYNYSFMLNVLGWEKGTYSVRLYVDATLKVERKFTL